jgi:serine/threonine protein kinase
MRCNDGGPKSLLFQTSANLIADVADGMTWLHDHDIVYADLKPCNILLFLDIHLPGGLVAKIADFGFAGITMYTKYRKRTAYAGDRPRSGTAEWSATECLDNPDPWIPCCGLEYPRYKSCIDIYSFRLLSCYVALDGQTPGQYVPNLPRAKLSGTMLDKAVARLEEHYCEKKIVMLVNNRLSSQPYI